MNNGKTESMIIGTYQQLAKHSIDHLPLGNSIITPTISAKIDLRLFLEAQINKICRSSFFYLHNIRRIRKFLSSEASATLVHAFITCRLDYCNSLYYGLPGYQISKLQRIQNAGARIICQISRYTNIAPCLIDLHWLPVSAHYYI